MRRVLKPPAAGVRPSARGVRAVLLLWVLAMAGVRCTPVGVPTTRPAPEGASLPPIERGGLSTGQSQEAARLLEAAKDSLGLGLPVAALDLAQRVIRGYPRAPGSSEALWVLARAAGSLRRAPEAAEAAARYAELLTADHPAYPGVLLFEARSWTEAGVPSGAASTLLLLPPATPDSILQPARELFREVADEVPPQELADLLEEAPLTSPLFGLGAAHAAAGFYVYGAKTEAERWARSALETSLPSAEEALVRGVLGGTLEETLRTPVVLGAVLPRSGVSPGLQEYAESIYEGIQVAVEEFQPLLSRPVQLEVADDQGEAEGGRSSVRDLEAAGAMGIVGPLTPAVLAGAAAARERGLVMISPSAFLPAEDAAGVLSLSGPDLAGSRLVARYAWDLGIERVVVLRPRTEKSGEDARAFTDAFGELGGTIPREIVYDSGATFFQAEFTEVASLLPDGLFLPLEPADIQVLAPQFTFYGLDTLGIQLLGTSGWTEDAVVLDVDSRHTDGVIAATSRLRQGDMEGAARFKAGYEDLFQKTLRSDVPALGYDAAALLLTALENRPRTPEELQAALSQIRDFPGATGRLSLENGRIVREPHLIRIQNHELIYISPRFQ